MSDERGKVAPANQLPSRPGRRHSACDNRPRMTTMMEKLLTAQKTLLATPAQPAAQEALLNELRQSVPAPILAHFLRLIAQKRKGVALLRHGVCSECHLRAPFGLAAVLAKSDDLHLCENCGCYLALDPNEQLVAEPVKAVPTARAVRPRRRATSVAVA